MYWKEYQHNGKAYRLALPDAEYVRKLGCVTQRTRAHQLNGNQTGIYREIAATWAIMLGIPPEEAAELPVRLLIEIMRDCEEVLEAYKKAVGK